LDPGNQLTLAGTLVARDALRYTPAGVPIVSFRVAHASQQSEAGAARQVEMEMACVAVEERARLIAAAPVVACVTPVGLVVATWQALKEPSYSAVMAATGLMYLAILTGTGMDLLPRALLS